MEDLDVSIDLFIKKISIASNVDFFEIVKVRKLKRKFEALINHTALPPEIIEGRLVGQHNISVIIKDATSKKELGVCDVKLISIITGDDVNSLYESWKENYNNLPEDIRGELEAKMSWALLPSISILFEKMGLPPAIPPIVFSSRKVSR